jgi:hypothetical protein
MSRRNEIQIAQDRAKVCDLLRQGFRSKTEIASILNEHREKDSYVTPQQVAADIEYMKEKYLNQGIEDYNLYRNQIIDELNMLKRTYWKGYDLSRRNKISIESKFITDKEDYEGVLEEGIGLGEDEDVFSRQADIREETRVEGNPSFLQGVQTCIDRIAKIYGIDAPNKIALTDPSGQVEATNAFELMKRRMDELESRRNQAEDVAETKLLNE